MSYVNGVPLLQKYTIFLDYQQIIEKNDKKITFFCKKTGESELLYVFFSYICRKNSDSSYRFNRLKFIIMSQSVLFFIIVLVIVFAVMVSSYFHKRHHEFNMGDIEKAVRGAYPAGVRSITKDELVKGVKKHFHCSSKDAHYIIGVARRKKLVDIAANHVTLL